MEDVPTPRRTIKKLRRTRLSYKPGEPRVFNPARVGTTGYPKTEEAFLEKQALNRKSMADKRAAGVLGTRAGVPDGWGGLKHKFPQIKAKALAAAKRKVARMKANGELVEGLDERGEEALAYALSVIRASGATDSKAGDAAPELTRDRLTATKIVLEYTRQKPATKIEAKVSKAEDFLSLLAGEKPSE